MTASIIIEYLDQHYPGRTRFIAEDPKRALRTRLQDRFYDLYVHQQVQHIVGDRLRPADKKDPFGVAEAKARADDGLRHDRAGHGGPSLGGGRCIQHGGLRRRPGAVLRQQGAAARRLQEHRGLSGTADATPVLCAGAEEAEPYFRFFPEEA